MLSEQDFIKYYDTSEYYQDLWKIYTGPFYKFMRSKVCKHSGIREGEFMLDIGSGTGWFSQYATSQRTKVIALDINAQGFYLMRKLYSEGDNEVAFIIGDGCNLPFSSNIFDGVNCAWVLEHVMHPEQMVSEICRVLKPAGRLITYTPAQATHVRSSTKWTGKVLKSLFTPGRIPIRTKIVDLDLATYDKHPGSEHAWHYNFWYLHNLIEALGGKVIYSRGYTDSTVLLGPFVILYKVLRGSKSWKSIKNDVEKVNYASHLDRRDFVGLLARLYALYDRRSNVVRKLLWELGRFKAVKDNSAGAFIIANKVGESKLER